MLTQWRYKICKKFTVEGGKIYGAKRTDYYLHTKPRPDDVYLYKPSGKKYDYVDYTGSGKHLGVTCCDKTTMLEFLGYIKYVERKSLDESGLK